MRAFTLGGACLLASLCACGAGGSGARTPPPPPPPTTFTVGGTLAGLAAGRSLDLVLNHDARSDLLALSADGPFAFPTQLLPGVAWEVDLQNPPAGQQCTVANATGTLGEANVTDVVVTCQASAPLHTLGGVVSGLARGSVTLRNTPNADQVTLSADGPFTFGVEVPSRAPYEVTVVTQPGGLRCLVAGGVGFVGDADVTSVAVTCSAFAPVAGVLHAGNMGGAGNADGTRGEARFNSPVGVAGGYVADQLNHRLRSVSDGGVVVTVSGSTPTTADGPLANVYFSSPQGLAEGPDGAVYVAESGRNRIRRIANGAVTTLAGDLPSGSADGAGAAARFAGPSGVAVDADGVVYVADTLNHTIRRITPAGEVSTLAGAAGQTGRTDGAGATARFFFPSAVAFSPAANLLFVADTGNKLLRSVTPAGEVVTVAGSTAGHLDAPNPLAARFQSLDGLAVDAAGAVFVADGQNEVIRKVTPALGVETYAGVPHSAGHEDGARQLARFHLPVGLGFRGGDLWVTDNNNHTVRKIAASGEVSTVAGLASEGASVDGAVETARFIWPTGLALGATAGELLVADRYGARIRAVHPDPLTGGAASVGTFSGSGLSGSNDGAAPIARFREPWGVAARGRWVADAGNRLLRRLDDVGTALTAAGTAGAAGVVDGVGPDARFLGPYDAWEAPSGEVYLADAYAIRRYEPGAGAVVTIAGGATGGLVDGAGAAARFRGAEGLDADVHGNLYVADTQNHAIRRVTPAGEVTTVAGNGVAGYADGPLASARFRLPTDVAVAADGTLYVADQGNTCVRAISPAGIVSTLVGTPGVTGFSPNATPSAIGPPRKLVLDGDVLYVTMLQGVARFTITRP